MKVLRTIIILALSLLGGIALFGCGETHEVPEVKDVKITADGDSYGVAGAVHHLVYTAPAGCTVTTAVQLGKAAATVNDYLGLDGGYIFYTEGEYTVTVYAAKDGMVGSASAKVQIHAGDPFVGAVTIKAAAGEAYGKTGAVHLLSYSAPAESTVEVTIAKEGAEQADAVYDEALGTLVFGSAGKYTVTVTATIGEDSASGSASIEVTSDDAAAELTLSLDKRSLQEEGAAVIRHTAVCAPGDEICEEELTVFYRKSGVSAYREADSENYSVTGDLFTPHVAGNWKLTYRIATERGASAEKSVELDCEPAPIELLPVAAEVRRIEVGTAAEVSCPVEGLADKYDVTFDTHGNEHVTAEQGNGNCIRVTADAVDRFSVTVIYTHKVRTSVRKTCELEFYSVENLTYAPVFGEDPFDGMPSDVLTSMGHFLYFDAKTSGGVPRTLTYSDVKYEVIEHHVTASSGGTAVELLHAADDENAPYVIVSNFDNNVATGNFTLKMTVTDPYTGYSAVAAKTFNVIPTGNNNADAAKVIQNYVDEHADFYEPGSMTFGNISSDCRQNMVLTKTGVIMQRSNPSWPLQDGNKKANSDFAAMTFGEPTKNCRLEFDFRLLGPNPVSQEVWLGIGVRTVDADMGWSGFFDLHAVDGKLAVTCGLTNVKAEYDSGFEMPDAVRGASFSVRLDRRVSGSLATYTLYIAKEPGQYEEYLRFVFDVSNRATVAGAPVMQYQFTHRNAGGCYAVEHVTLTSFDA